MNGRYRAAFLLVIFILCPAFPAFALDQVALDSAIKNGDEEIIAEALRSGLAVNEKIEGWPLVVIAANHGREEILRILLDEGADVDARNSQGDTALILAAYNNYGNILELLLNKGADADLRGFDGGSALLWAVKNGYANTVDRLLNSKANVDLGVRPHWAYSGKAAGQVDREGATALMLASRDGRDDIVRLLLDAGADVNAMDAGCNDAWDYARSSSATGNVEIMQSLEEYGADNKPACWQYDAKFLIEVAFTLFMLIVLATAIRRKSSGVSGITIYVVNYIWCIAMIVLFIPEIILYPDISELTFGVAALVPFITIAAEIFRSNRYLLMAALFANTLAALLFVVGAFRSCSGQYHPVAFAILDSIFFIVMTAPALINVVVMLSRMRRNDIR